MALLVKSFRWRMLFFIIAIGGVCIVVLVIRSCHRQGLLWNKYQKLQLGMTRTEVEEVLGPATDVEYLGGSINGPVCTWSEQEHAIVVSFDFAKTSRGWEEGVVNKRFVPETICDKWGKIFKGQ